MLKLRELAQLIKADLRGDSSAEIARARPFDLASEGDITLAMDAAFKARISETHATAVIVAEPIEASGANLVVAHNPKLAFARAIQILHRTKYEPIGVSRDLIAGEGTVLGHEPSIYPRVTIGRGVVIGDRVTLHPGVAISDRCRIGDDTIIYANVSIYDDCEIGGHVIIHSGTVIGADGFGFVADEEGRQLKLLQLGRVLVEDDCEIGANCTIDRGGFGETVLRRGVKLDNLVHVGHNCEIGEDTVVAAMSGFSGGTRVGRRCVIAGQVGTAHHVSIGDGVTITGGAAVTKDVPAGKVMSGMIPARDHNAWRRSQVLYSKLPELAERLRRLERTVESLT
ncbi:MAG TPA: UDP-3-O-(3-hydroxymyristoyl)glucosamine N-acyltransferase, partial [Blastocatellia bacterium]|nr:UDP-3-O-(3-hydroxymyristoyl)glucosamine N-acyltransferase [Blastocatellia bacterium]